MKTLDEVIKAFEICDETVTANCPDCPYDIDCENVPGEDLRTDALHYLREYREKHDEILRMEEALGYCEIMANPPLTWDELRAMTGKPVWIEDNIDEPEDLTKYWAIYRRIEKAQETEYALLSEFYYDKAQYGKTWQAYRKERT